MLTSHCFVLEYNVTLCSCYFCGVTHRWVPTQAPSCWWNHSGVRAGPGARSLASSLCIRPALPSYSQPTASSSLSATPAPWRWTGGQATLGLSWLAKRRSPGLKLKQAWGGPRCQGFAWLKWVAVWSYGIGRGEDCKGLVLDCEAEGLWSN